MKQKFRKNIVLTALTYGAIITGVLDLQSNFSIFTYCAIYLILFFVIMYRYNKRISKMKYSEFKPLIFIFPIVIVVILGFKITKVYTNMRAPNIEGEWKVIELIVDSKTIESTSPICDKLVFWKHGIMVAKEKGIYNLRYHFGITNKLNIDGGSIRTNHSKNYCVERSILRKMDIVDSYKYKLSFDTLRLENENCSLVLIKE